KPVRKQRSSLSPVTWRNRFIPAIAATRECFSCRSHSIPSNSPQKFAKRSTRERSVESFKRPDSRRPSRFHGLRIQRFHIASVRYIKPRVTTLKDIEDARKRIEGAVY